jgi:hypothetical protein
MNAKQVLDRIVKALSLSKEEVLFTYAKLADGTILESPTFDVGEAVDVVTEDGKSPAPAGEHEVILKDSEGNDVRIKIMVDAEGKITERENVELPASETEDEKSEAVEMESIAGGDMGDDEEVATEETANPIPEDEDMKSVIEKMAYRIEELEKKMQSMQDVKSEGGAAPKVKTEDLPGDPTKVNTVEKMAAVEPDEDEVEEEELPKLDGAPIDENAPKQNGVKFNKKGAVVNTQNSFLSKLYK